MQRHRQIRMMSASTFRVIAMEMIVKTCSNAWTAQHPVTRANTFLEVAAELVDRIPYPAWNVLRSVMLDTFCRAIAMAQALRTPCRAKHVQIPAKLGNI
jgi:hypothetical protein